MADRVFGESTGGYQWCEHMYVSVCVCMYVCVLVRETVRIYSGLSVLALETPALLWIFKEPIHYWTACCWFSVCLCVHLFGFLCAPLSLLSAEVSVFLWLSHLSIKCSQKWCCATWGTQSCIVVNDRVVFYIINMRQTWLISLLLAVCRGAPFILLLTVLTDYAKYDTCIRDADRRGGDGE